MRRISLSASQRSFAAGIGVSLCLIAVVVGLVRGLRPEAPAATGSADQSPPGAMPPPSWATGPVPNPATPSSTPAPAAIPGSVQTAKAATPVAANTQAVVQAVQTEPGTPVLIPPPPALTAPPSAPPPAIPAVAATTPPVNYAGHTAPGIPVLSPIPPALATPLVSAPSTPVAPAVPVAPAQSALATPAAPAAPSFEGSAPATNGALSPQPLALPRPLSPSTVPAPLPTPMILAAPPQGGSEGLPAGTTVDRADIPPSSGLDASAIRSGVPRPSDHSQHPFAAVRIDEECSYLVTVERIPNRSRASCACSCPLCRACHFIRTRCCLSSGKSKHADKPSNSWVAPSGASMPLPLPPAGPAAVPPIPKAATSPAQQLPRRETSTDSDPH
jgi:hypothetical protein